MNERAEEWNRLVSLIEEADALQQLLVPNGDASHEFHNLLNQIADEFTDFANAEGVDIG